jgi:hypothetical protein
MIPMQSGLFKFNNVEKSSKKTAIKTFNYEILLNGRVLGYVDSSEIEELIFKIVENDLKALASMPMEPIKMNSLTDCQSIWRYVTYLKLTSIITLIVYTRVCICSLVRVA